MQEAQIPVFLFGSFENKSIEPIGPSGREATFLPISFKPLPKPLPKNFKEFIIVLIMAPITVPSAMTIAATEKPIFLKKSLSLFLWVACLPLSLECAC